jgi:hypothetical protein
MKQVKVTVSKEEYQGVGKVYSWCLPLKKKYSRWIPQQAFALGEDDVLLAEKPEEIVFRKRWSFRKSTRKIRMAVLQHDNIDGADDVYIKLYLI